MSIIMKRDNLYSDEQNNIGDFIFDDKVAAVFEDMVKRSVPGYQAIVNMVGMVAEEHVRAQTNCYDLGCSVGACTASMGRAIKQEGVKIIAVDNSESMTAQCRSNLEQLAFNAEVQVVCEDIWDTDIQNASMVVLNFTLQFFTPERRQALLKKIYDGMIDGGILILSEKIKFDDAKEEEFQQSMHHAFKRLQGYSDLEIAQKRSALENVLISDTLGEHKQRLTDVGFTNIYLWFQCFNFVSLVAFK